MVAKEKWTDRQAEMLREIYATVRADIGVQTINDATGSTFTRNAYIGKAKRLELVIRRQPSSAPKPLRKKTRKRNFNHRRLLALDQAGMGSPPTSQTEFLGVTLQKLERHHCRFPQGEYAPCLFCGQPKIEGSSFCGLHHRICYTQRQG